MKWVELTIRTTTLGADAMAEVLFDAGVNGVSIEDHADVDLFQRNEEEWDYIDENICAEHGTEVYVKGYLPYGGSVYSYTNKIMQRAAAIVENSSEDFDVGRGEVLVRMVEDEDWSESWKQYYKPIEVGETLAICPQWEQYNGERTVIMMDPGMAFGTGQHETTLMCLEFCEQFAHNGMCVLDVGCGTGILGIASALIGAQSVLCTDRDSVAVSAVRINSELNNVEDIVSFQLGNLADGVKGEFDLVFANIVADAIIPLMQSMKKLLARQGNFIASGIIAEREADVMEAAKAARLKLKDRKAQGEWVALAFAKK